MREMYNRLVPLNLQFFAANVTTDAALADEIKTYYDKHLIDLAEPELKHDQFATRYPIPKGTGKTIEFRKFSSLPKAVTALTEGVTPSGGELAVSDVTASIAQYGYFLELSDLLDFTAVDRMVEEALSLLGAQAGRTLDTITREVITGGTNKMFAPKVSGGTETEVLLRADVTGEALLTPKVVRLAANQLKRMNARPFEGGDYVAVIHPDVSCDLMGSSEWLNAHQYAQPENIYSGEIGRLYGVRFVETTEAKIVGPADIFTGVPRLTLKTALDSTGSVDIMLAQTVTSAQAAELTARIAAGTVKVYVGGKEATLASVTAGAPGTAKLVATAAVKDVAADSVICGQGAGKDGSAVYCTLFIARGAYGVTELSGMGLQTIVKQLGSGGTADPLNQRSTVGWKASKVAERLVEEYMIRVEHSSHYGDKAVGN